MPRKREPVQSDLMDRFETAEFLTISVRTLEIKTARNEVPGFCKLFGTMARWSRSKLQAWLDAGSPETLRTGAQNCAKRKPHIDQH